MHDSGRLGARPSDGGQTSVLIVEDHVTAFQSVWSRLDAMRGADGAGEIVAKVASHDRAVQLARTGSFDVALVDALRHGNERFRRPELSLQAGVEVAQAFQDDSPRTRVIAYSARASDPAINITVREVPGVCAVYDSAELLDAMSEAVLGPDCPGQVPLPTDTDYESLNLLPSARPWSALQLASSRPEVWRAVVDFGSFSSLPVSERDWFNDKLFPLLPLAKDRPTRRYPELIKVLRRLAFFD